MTALAPPTASPDDSIATASRASWSQAAGLVGALVAFGWLADLQGVWFHRAEFQTVHQWLVPGLAYAGAAGLAMWKWDWLVRVALSWRFAVVAVLAIAAIWLASTQRVAARPAGVPLLHDGERDRLPLDVVPLAAAVPVTWVTPNPDRFAAAEADAQGQDSGQPAFEYDLPAGWTAQPSTSMRPVNLRVAGDARCDCYLSSLPGAAGGILENVNRWRKQMGAAPIDEDALAKLPRAKLLGREAVVVEVDGTFSGMGGASLEGARMVGAIASLPAVTLFLKMTGPKEVVQKERAAFDKLLASVRMRGMGKAHAAAQPPVADRAADRAADGGADSLHWTAPKGWQAGAERPMRLVTFEPQGTAGVECYVTVLPGAAGGVVDNVNRWRGQFGQAAQTEGQIAGLPTVKVLGKDSPIVELSGTFTGMGGEGKEEYGLLGTIAPFQDNMVFVKMIGPQAQVKAERERFLEFCRSIAGQ